MDATTMSVYNQILDFSQDFSRLELVFRSPDSTIPAMRSNIQFWAGRLGLKFKYSEVTECATITHRHPISAQQDHHPTFSEDFHDFIDLDNMTTSQPDTNHTHVYDAMSSMDIDWDDVFSGQNVTGLDAANHHDRMDFNGSALPELETFGDTEISDILAQAPPYSLDLGKDLDSMSQPGFASKDPKIPERQPFISYADFLASTSLSQPAPNKKTDYILGQIFEKLEIQEYLDVFLQQGFDTWEAVLDITESDLDAMSVKLGHRRKLQREIANFKSASCDIASDCIGYPTLQDSEEGTLESNSLQYEIPQAVLKGKPFDFQAHSAKKSRLIEDTERGTDSIFDRLRTMYPPKSSALSMTSGKAKHRVTKLFSGRRSTQEENYPGYQVWDSRSSISGSSSISSAASGRSTRSIGRQGPLSGAARAMANAVKAVKACWRCKFMRKPCGVELPCKSCPKGLNGGTKMNSASAWSRVGCKRGNFEDEMPEISLCPMRALYMFDVNPDEEDRPTHATVNFSWKETHKRRHNVLAKIFGKDDVSFLDYLVHKQRSSTVEGNAKDDGETPQHPPTPRHLGGPTVTDILAEKLDDSLDPKRSLEEQQASTCRDDPYQETQKWLSTFISQANKYTEHKRILEEKLDMVKQACHFEGLIDIDGDLNDFQTTDEDTFDGEDILIQDLKYMYFGLEMECGKDEALLRRLIPLHAYVIFILWDLNQCPSLQDVVRPIHGPNHMTDDASGVFRSAAEYQQSVKDNKLITLSLSCLLTCLEALRVYPACMSPSSHQECNHRYHGYDCMVRCIPALESSLKRFLEELSMVFFKKDNLRSRSWWLSAFYAFSIQSMVRRGLQILVNPNPDKSVRPDSRQWRAVQNYLSVALRLFIATSSHYDPLVRDYSVVYSASRLKTKEEYALDEHFKAAQVAVQQDTWKSNGIENSMQYLQNLFEDTEEF